MKNSKHVLILAVTLALCLGAVIGAAAAGGLTEITAYLDPEITVRYNGELRDITDSTGAPTSPVTYNSTTYVPIRAISNILGVKVDWDQATKTILLGEEPSVPSAGVDLIDTYKPYSTNREYGSSFFSYQTSDYKGTDISGISVSHYIKMNHLGGIAGKKGNIASGYYNIEGKYNTLTFRAYASGDAVLQISGDEDVMLAEFDLKGEQIAQTFTVDLKNTSQLCIKLKATGVTSDVYVFDAILK